MMHPSAIGQQPRFAPRFAQYQNTQPPIGHQSHRYFGDMHRQHQQPPPRSFDLNESLDPLREHITSWTPNLENLPDWNTSADRRSPVVRDDPFEYRGPSVEQMSSGGFSSRSKFAPPSSQSNSSPNNPPLKSILKNKNESELSSEREERNVTNERSGEALPVIPTSGFNNIDEEDEFLYGDDSQERNSKSVTSETPLSSTVDRSSMSQPPSQALSNAEYRSAYSRNIPSNIWSEDKSDDFSFRPHPSRYNRSPSPHDTPMAGIRFNDAEQTQEYNSNVYQPQSVEESSQLPPESYQNSVMQLPKIPKKEDAGQSSSEPAPSDPNEEINNLIQKRDKLTSQLNSLKALLERTIKKEGDLLRNRKSGSRDPQVLENQKLMNDVRKKIESVHDQHTSVCKQLLRLQAGKEKSTETSQKESDRSSTAAFSSLGMSRTEDSDDEEYSSRFEHYDPGNHWCVDCDELVPKIRTYLEHLHAKDHWKHVDLQHEPWKPKNAKPKIAPSENSSSIPFKGVQFFYPVKGFYCNLCAVFVGNEAHAEDHLKTPKHNRNYTKFTLLNPQYEHKWNTDKGKALSRKQQEEKKRQKEEQEKEEREKERLRKKQEEELRKKEKAERLREERRLKELKDEEDEKRDQRDRFNARNRSSEKQKEKRKAIYSSSSRESSPEITREKVPEAPVYGPHFPFNDCKLVTQTIVEISSKDIRRAYKAHLKAMLRERKKKRSASEISNNNKNHNNLPSNPVVEDNNDENCELDTSDILASINKKCEDFDEMKENNFGFDADDETEANKENQETKMTNETNENDSPPSAQIVESEKQTNEANEFCVPSFSLERDKSDLMCAQKNTDSLVVLHRINFDEEEMEVEKSSNDSGKLKIVNDLDENSVGSKEFDDDLNQDEIETEGEEMENRDEDKGEDEERDEEEENENVTASDEKGDGDKVESDVYEKADLVFPTLDLNDLAKSPPYSNNFNSNEDMFKMDYN
ncbi:uncharacterized protein B4U79_16348 [Dinothrombium tinctorium]|uniref:U1-type domain-containing protein n=1 Tax=Dinothrombium tinctorium TaxID=1965070 RepID=A0A443QPU8_9ACAR|nr:uncharacterized protein B4U79_16348 [Dinothrombium tinctorium]